MSMLWRRWLMNRAFERPDLSLLLRIIAKENALIANTPGNPDPGYRVSNLIQRCVSDRSMVGMAGGGINRYSDDNQWTHHLFPPSFAEGTQAAIADGLKTLYRLGWIRFQLQDDVISNQGAVRVYICVTACGEIVDRCCPNHGWIVKQTRLRNILCQAPDRT